MVWGMILWGEELCEDFIGFCRLEIGRSRFVGIWA